MKVKISDLKKVSNIILNHLVELGINEIDLEKDYYKDIPYPEIYDLDKKLDLEYFGQLYNDWEDLQKILSGKSDAIGYGLVWISSIFRYIGENFKG